MRSDSAIVRRDTTDRASFAYGRLRNLIVHGQLAPGTSLVETDLAERLGVSRTPVRSAVQRLQQEGFLVTRTEGVQARSSVAPLTREDAGELFGIVGALEALAVRQVADLPAEQRVRLVEQLTSANRALKMSAHDTLVSASQFFERDGAFHEAFVAAGSGPRLQAMYEASKPQAERYIRLYVSSLQTEIGTSVREHDVIIECIERGERELAQEAVITNWENAASRLCTVIDLAGERGSW